MPLAGFEPTILASERPQTHALDRSANGIGMFPNYKTNRIGLGQIMHVSSITDSFVL
jgi:hypothetical protein